MDKLKMSSAKIRLIVSVIDVSSIISEFSKRCMAGGYRVRQTENKAFMKL